MMNQYPARILDVASYLPEKILGNTELSAVFPDWSPEKIYEKTGIEERRIVDNLQTAGDLAVLAAEKLFAKGLFKRESVDFLILCTQAPDYILPTTACVIQHKLGLMKTCGAIDINLGCSGFVYGLSLAKGLIASGAAKNILLITADTYSKYINPLDRSVRTLFGDAAAATAVVAGLENTPSIGSFVFGTDGSGAENLIVKAGGFRLPYSELTKVETIDDSGNVRSSNDLYMNGADVLAFSLREVPKAVDALLIKAEVAREKVDLFVLHQANKFMLDALRKKLKLPEEKLPILMRYCGNTVSSTIPIALEDLGRDAGLAGKKVMLVGFGVGYSWAACLIDF